MFTELVKLVTILKKKDDELKLAGRVAGLVNIMREMNQVIEKIFEPGDKGAATKAWLLLALKIEKAIPGIRASDVFIVMVGNILDLHRSAVAERDTMLRVKGLAHAFKEVRKSIELILSDAVEQGVVTSEQAQTHIDKAYNRQRRIRRGKGPAGENAYVMSGIANNVDSRGVHFFGARRLPADALGTVGFDPYDPDTYAEISKTNPTINFENFLLIAKTLFLCAALEGIFVAGAFRYEPSGRISLTRFVADGNTSVRDQKIKHSVENCFKFAETLYKVGVTDADVEGRSVDEVVQRRIGLIFADRPDAIPLINGFLADWDQTRYGMVKILLRPGTPFHNNLTAADRVWLDISEQPIDEEVIQRMLMLTCLLRNSTLAREGKEPISLPPGVPPYLKNLTHEDLVTLDRKWHFSKRFLHCIPPSDEGSGVSFR